METIIRETKLGKIKGLVYDDAYEFKGIPYAVTKRFEKPERIDEWEEEILDATKQEIDCYQYATFRDDSEVFYTKEFVSGKKYIYAESPMTLTITTPKVTKKNPVLVFIHGGGWETGNVGDLPYGECFEYAKRDIILVSVGYRLNVFSLYENGNYGLLDQKCAIEWVYDHIADFGGDPHQITLMGQSAGAMSIMDQVYSQNLKGKIRGIITMSGGGVMPLISKPFTKEQAAEFWKKVRERAGVSAEEVKTVDVAKLWDAWYEESRSANSPQAVVPGIDGEIIKETPQKTVFKGEDLDVPAMIGITSQDFMAPFMYQMALRYGLRNSLYRRSRVYCYFFDRTLPGNLYKAYHAADLWYMFGNMEKCWRPFEKTDYDLSRMMMDYVANFVRYQNPNGRDLPQWDYITPLQRRFRWLDGESDGMIQPIKAFKKTVISFTKDKGPM